MSERADEIQLFDSMRVRRGNSHELGSCNACARHCTASGQLYHDVREITFRGMLVRVCDECAKELIQKLKEHA